MSWLPPPQGHTSPSPQTTAGPPPSASPAPPAAQPDGAAGGLNRCPVCGSTEVQLRISAGVLTCMFCRHSWAEEQTDVTGNGDDLTQLSGVTVAAGAAAIDANVDDVVTLKCGGCGAEVVVNTAEQLGSRCHWCRHILTIDAQIANGAVPDAVLPFSISHDEAVERIEAFAGKRRRFADREFLAEFAPQNIVGVYMPYMVVDVNASGDVAGHGEIETRRYERGSEKSKTTYYDADVYAVQRHVDFVVDDLTVEASAERANIDASQNTNNIINTILPFDTKNAVRWNPSYLTGFTSEKRTLDVTQLRPVVEDQLLSITRAQVEPSVKRRYDRGVRWERERIQVHGVRWVSMYLPVWLYSHYHEERGRGMVHYIAVNGRTGETMGSVPVSKSRLLGAAVGVGAVVEAAAAAVLVALS